ncbi:putative peptidyl-tRNA hydrolase [Phialemonium atrogriseum]|uniref:peptidyl-tRNA hydrolase n=1 Tax=Phialemonium atrogriseum TaxID=1093897 RepID=A0AAJ0BS20_9PEZI|nr:putative peptidyl-tRNA hydrolase [Phialemonium atrogriseum]KAK1763210.1 putative peptidyl-tRNA hydrolase [Phialemonium atrogriseum]
MFNPRFLVISLGNPAPYVGTLHSVGHLAVASLQKILSPEQPPFASERHGKKSVLASAGPKYTLLQSPTLMNISGPWVAKAWKEMLANRGLAPADLSLVLVHDDLEEDLGVVKIRQWSRSHRGHNGVKSVNSSLLPKDYNDPRWSRISVGIGRPEGRDRTTVSDYVLREMTKWEKSVIEDKATPAVLDALLELERKWERESEEAGGEEKRQR